MTPSAAHTLRLEDLENGATGLSKTWGHFVAEAAMVCLQRHNHATGVALEVRGAHPATCAVCWARRVAAADLALWDQDEATEYGACGVAALLLLALTDYTIVRKARRGEGVDYWLAYRDADPPFQEAARVEVSGIFDGDEHSIKARVTQKLRQTSRSDLTGVPAYVAVVEFGRPLSHLERR